MRLFDLYERLEAENGPAFVISKDDHRILFANTGALSYAPGAEEGHSFIAALCGRKAPCDDCLLNTELDENETFASASSLCSFAKVSFCKVSTSDGEVIVSRWRDENADPIADCGFFELEGALENLGNSRETLDSILLTYLRDSREKPAVIRSYFDSKEIKKLRIEVHGLKSASYIVGLKAFGDLSKQMEYACRAVEAADEATEPTSFEVCGIEFSADKKDEAETFISDNIGKYLSDLSDILKVLAEYFNESADALDNSLAAGSTDTGSSDDPASFDRSSVPADIKELLEKASSALSVYDLDTAQDALATALSASSDNDLTSIIKKALSAIDSFDYDAAGSILSDLI